MLVMIFFFFNIKLLGIGAVKILTSHCGHEVFPKHFAETKASAFNPAF
jgi:hypothetical protein